MIEKVRVHEIAKELGIASKEVLAKASDMGIEVKSAQSTLTMEQAEGLANFIMNGEVPTQKPKPAKRAPAKSKNESPKKEESPKEDVVAKEIEASP